MSQAAPISSTITPPSQRGPVAFGKAMAPNAIETESSVSALGFHLAAAQREYRRLDEVAVSPEGTSCDERAMEAVYRREIALEGLIATLPARTLAEAAVQIGVLCSKICILECNEWNDARGKLEMRDLHREVFNLALSALPVIAEAADLDLAAMCWDDWLKLRDARLAGEVRA